MSKAKKLTKSQLDRFRVDLLERKQWLLGEIRDRIGDSESVEDGNAGDDVDRATLAVTQELSLGTAARESREIQLIEEALDRIESGEYGRCEECDEAMAPARLEALPYAEYCIDCQERIEEEEGLYVESPRPSR